MKPLLLLLIPLLVGPLRVVAQSAVLLSDEQGSHIITGCTERVYKYEVDGKPRKVSINGTGTRFLPIGTWFPGHILVEDLKAKQLTTTFLDDGSEHYSLQYNMKVTANRDMDDVFLMMYTQVSPEKHMNVACAVGDLRKGRPRRLTFSLSVEDDFQNSTFRPIFFCRGYEVPKTEVPVADQSPIVQYFEKYPEKAGKDGPPVPFVVVRLNPPKGPDGKEPLHGSVQFELEIDEQGYVVKARPVEPKDGPLVQAVDEVIYLWQFKPRIEKGKPVKCTLRVPFSF